MATENNDFKSFIATEYDKGVDGYIEKRTEIATSVWNYMDQQTLIGMLKDLEKSWGSFKCKSALDLGCGPGLSTRILNEMGLEVKLGLDLSFVSVQRAKEINISIPFSQADAELIPLKNGSLDLVFGEFLPNYIPNLDNFAKEVARVLKPNGEVLFSMGHPAGEILENGESKVQKVKVLKPMYFDNGAPYRWSMFGKDGNEIFNMVSFHHTFQNVFESFSKVGFRLMSVKEETATEEIKQIRPDLYDYLIHYPSNIAYRFKLEHE